VKHIATAKRPGEIWQMDNGYRLGGVHFVGDCMGEHCVIHNPSNHVMSEFPLHWRDDRLIFERICPHGIGHPDPDQSSHWEATMDEDDAGAMGIHGCDGCCWNGTPIDFEVEHDRSI